MPSGLRKDCARRASRPLMLRSAAAWLEQSGELWPSWFRVRTIWWSDCGRSSKCLGRSSMSISSEAVVMGVKAGLDAKQIMEVINAGTGRNSATADKIPRCVIPRAFNTGFSIALLNKDVRLCLEEGDALGVPMIVGNAVRQLLAITQASEGPDADMTETVKPLEKWT